MSVLIKGMEMPTFRDDYVAIVIYGDGTIRSFHGFVIDGATAVPVPPHGRLIDADALIKQVKRDGIRSDPFVRIVCDYFKDAPTIIEAEEGKDVSGQDDNSR